MFLTNHLWVKHAGRRNFTHHSSLQSGQTYSIRKWSLTSKVYPNISSNVDISIFVWNFEAKPKRVKWIWGNITEEVLTFFSITSKNVTISNLDMDSNLNKSCLTLWVKVKGNIRYPFDLDVFQRQFTKTTMTKSAIKTMKPPTTMRKSTTTATTK